jgi:hypothetical protein
VNEDHTPGICYACHKKKPVRWKNLYTIGSEGTDLCIKCELIVVNLLRDMSREATIERVKVIKEMKRRNKDD